MVAEHLEDGEGELLRRMRILVGADIPVVASLDFHSNTTPAMMEYADALVGYCTYPHIDMADTGRPGARWKGCPDSGPIVCRETGMSIVR